ncbi:hypothetical protein BDN72DRAFT_826239 [Pluteus cervinus]|uniref:Uncharacterized protein n=1 Tax=Pluteus cervinus TaxID=181527 RepID=A0ACD3ADC6_9AGAR|nr:hypothetical protein BDN72DRAFT_826239 [Pluteus cervinus]
MQSLSIGDVSKSERLYDGAAESTTDVPKSGPFEFVKTFFEENQETIKSTATGLASLTSEGRSIESAVSSFAETAKVVIKGLDALAQVHPAIGVAVIAFKLVVTFDMTRRENNKKVLALKIEMQDMMAVLFELRHIRDPMEESPDGSRLGARIQTLMDKIANDVKDAGSACDAYLKKSFLARTLKSKIYENRLADYGTTFEDNKTELHRVLSMHTARGVDAANEKLSSMDNKVDQLLQIFRKLDSPREKEIQRLFDESGGVKACLESDILLESLVLKSGETLSSVGGSTRRGEDIGNARKVLLKEWQEDVGEMFKKNIIVFERKLDVQSKQLVAIQESNERIVTILSSGLHERILNIDLRTIWKEMGWKGSVKARHFVLALHDYYSDESFLRGQESHISLRDPVETPLDSTLDGSITSTTPIIDDRWALTYVNVTHVQPIIEAIDDDGTGFVSIKEVNTFVTSYPPDWTLLQRLAYWAAGWHITISSYKDKIYRQVQTIFKSLDRLVPANRNIVCAYLKDGSFVRLEHILRSTKSVETTSHDPELAKLIETYEKTEEERLCRNLDSVAYELDSIETVGLVTGPGRIERYLFPLIYLLLKRDLRIIMLACKSVIHEEELAIRLSSLYSVFCAVDERIERMTDIYKQVHADVSTTLGIFVFGMFRLYYEKVFDTPEGLRILARDNNSFLRWISNEDETLQDEIGPTLTPGLRLGPVDLVVLELGARPLDPPSPYNAEIPQDLSLLGYWSGHFWTAREDGLEESYLDLVELRIETVSDRKIAGVGQTWSRLLTIDGTIGEDNDMVFSVVCSNGRTLLCTGGFDPIRQRIQGSWTDTPATSDPDSESDDSQVVNRTILFLRTPSRLHRFVYTPTDFTKNPARSRWAFACNAILHETRRNSWSWMHFKIHIDELRRFVALQSRSHLRDANVTPNKELSAEEVQELQTFRRHFDVRVARLCVELARFQTHRLMVDHLEFMCDSCRRDIYETRIICLVCMKKGSNSKDNVDLCRECLTMSTNQNGNNHNPSHSMIKYERIVFDYDEVWSSRTIAAAAKVTLRSAEENTTTQGVADEGAFAHGDRSVPDSDHVSALLCICCSTPVTTPCWVCRTCPPDTFVCSACEAQRVAPPKDHIHELSDPLIRISTTDPEPLADDAGGLGIETRLAGLEAKLDERTNELRMQVNQLETKVNERFVQLESRIQEQFATLESLLRQVVAQTGPQSTPS